MAITTNTFTINAGFAKSAILTQLENAFTWLGWHGSTHTGIATGISVYSGGGTVGSSGDIYPDIRQTSTSGVGTDISFYISRSSGNINRVMVNRPGYGYTDGEVVTVSSEDIGTSASGASDLSITINVDGGASPVGYGSTNQFYDSDLSGTYPFAVQRHVIEENKKYGSTYRVFQVQNGSSSQAHTLVVSTGSAFHPYDTDITADKGLYYGNSLRGQSALDISNFEINQGIERFLTSSIDTGEATNCADPWTISSSSSYDLELNVYRSSIDPKFAVFSYKQSSLSSTHLTDNTFETFILHNYTSNLWDYNNVFLGGITSIVPSSGNSTTPELMFRTYTGYLDDTYAKVSMRSAETGYLITNGSAGNVGGQQYARIDTTYLPTTYPRSSGSDTYTEHKFYYRNNSTDLSPIGSDSDYNAVIKGIPLSALMIPCPYYLPDDFVLINFDYATPSANIQQGDTITISGSEVYTVITGTYNQTTRTRGILFCARKV